MHTGLNKPTETNPLRQNDERYVLVSQEFPQQEDGIDLADLAIAAWKNRFLFIVSWVILAQWICFGGFFQACMHSAIITTFLLQVIAL